MFPEKGWDIGEVSGWCRWTDAQLDWSSVEGDVEVLGVGGMGHCFGGGCK